MTTSIASKPFGLHTDVSTKLPSLEQIENTTDFEAKITKIIKDYKSLTGRRKIDVLMHPWGVPYFCGTFDPINDEGTFADAAIRIIRNSTGFNSSAVLPARLDDNNCFVIASRLSLSTLPIDDMDTNPSFGEDKYRLFIMIADDSTKMDELYASRRPGSYVMSFEDVIKQREYDAIKRQHVYVPKERPDRAALVRLLYSAAFDFSSSYTLLDAYGRPYFMSDFYTLNPHILSKDLKDVTLTIYSAMINADHLDVVHTAGTCMMHMAYGNLTYVCNMSSLPYHPSSTSKYYSVPVLFLGTYEELKSLNIYGSTAVRISDLNCHYRQERAKLAGSSALRSQVLEKCLPHCNH